jgi:hypothetical protein
MKIAVIGKGNVGKALAPNLQRAGHDVTYGVRDAADPRHADGDGVPIASVGEAAEGAEVVILAVAWDAVDGVLAECGPLGARILVDCTNPYDFRNALKPLIAPGDSGAALIAAKTGARVVKAFNQVGAAVMAQAMDARFRPLQFAASDDAEAKAKVLEMMRDIGFDARDAGGLEYARELEGMARLWIAQAFTGMPAATSWALTRTDA